MNRLQKLMSAPTASRSLRVVFACCFVAALCLGSFVLWRSSSDDVVPSVTAASAQQPPVSMELTRRPSLLVVGDDYASGYGGVPRNAYPYIMCNTVGVNCNVDAQTGTGLVNDGGPIRPACIG